MLGGHITQRVRPGEMPLAPTNNERLADWASRYYLVHRPEPRPFPAATHSALPGFSSDNDGEARDYVQAAAAAELNPLTS